MFGKKRITIDEMESMVTHDAMRRFPPVARSEFNVGGHQVAVVAKLKEPRGRRFEFLYMLDGEIVPRSAIAF